MKKAVLFAAGLLGAISLRAQECPMYYPNLVNAELGYSHFDRKGNLTSTSRQKVTDVRKAGGSTEVDVHSEHFDSKGKLQGTVDLTLTCRDGVFYFDMKNYLDQQSMKSYEDMEVTVEGGNLEFPPNLKAGDQLQSGELKMTFVSGGMTVMTMTVNITNRKVESVESVTTPAGTFECNKITYDIATKMLINMRMKGVEWYARQVGMVKSESFSNDGKLMGSSMLNTLSK